MPPGALTAPSQGSVAVIDLHHRSAVVNDLQRVLGRRCRLRQWIKSCETTANEWIGCLWVLVKRHSSDDVSLTLLGMTSVTLCFQIGFILLPTKVEDQVWSASLLRCDHHLWGRRDPGCCARWRNCVFFTWNTIHDLKVMSLVCVAKQPCKFHHLPPPETNRRAATPPDVQH